jgi:large subunit ribosomal protein L21
MYAVILSGGKQYRVQTGDVLKLETLPAEVGQDIDFDKVLLVGEGSDLKVGAPFLKSGKVSAKVLSHGRGKKVHIVKFQRRKHHEKWQGHRQNFTEVEITDIKG